MHDLGHDMFEGVVAYDIQVYLQHLVCKERLISAAELNERIKGSKLSQRDASNRPKNFKVRKPGNKYEGMRCIIVILKTRKSSHRSPFLRH